jgi:hypothetical protein
MKPRVTVALLAAALARTALAQCTPAWDDRFNYAALDGQVLASAVFDDGTGPALYIGGTFRNYLGAPLASIAKWDGQTFQSVGGGLSNTVYALTVWDADGPGPNPPALYAGGGFTSAANGTIPTSRIARWNGQTWSALPDAFSGSATVRALCAHNDGTGEKLIVGGSFVSIGAATGNLAAFDGHTWWGVNLGVSDTDNSASVQALTSLNEPAGPALYVGGDFSHAGGVPARALARLRNGQWTALGSGVTYTNFSGVTPVVQTLTAANLATTGGPCIVAGGVFDHAGGLAVAGIAKWSGTSWARLQYTGATNTSWGNVRMVGVADLGSGPALYASNYNGLERWNGTTWDLIGAGAFRAYTMAVDTQSAQRKLYIAGEFLRAGDAAAPGIAVYDGTTIAGIGATGAGLNGPVKAFTVGDLGQGRRLYAVGDFTHGSGLHLNHSAVWSGTGWAALGNGLPDLDDNGDSTSDFRGVAIHDDGTGPHLYAAEFDRGLFRLDGDAWQRLGTLDDFTQGVVTFDPDSAGPLPESIYVIGTIGIGPNFTPIARWTGSAWESAFTTNFTGIPAATAAHVFDRDGSGPQPAALYLAGKFNIGGVYSTIVKWDGQTWTSQAVPFSISSQPAYAFAIHDDGSGPNLYAAGSFSASTLMRLSGDDWEPYGNVARPYFDTTGTTNPPVRALVSVNLGQGPEFLMAGSFNSGMGALVVHRDGIWATFAYNLDNPAMLGSQGTTSAAAVFDDGTTSALFVSGRFGGTLLPGGERGPASLNIARLSLCTPGCTADFNADGDFGTDQDIEAFFACLAGHCCPRCGPADFNNDGDTGTDQDIEAFFRVLAGGVC